MTINNSVYAENNNESETNQNGTSNNDGYTLTGLAKEFGCPADSISLGKGTWQLLHSIAAYYPDQPSSEIQEDMAAFINIFSKFYPCPPCAADFRLWLKSNPPQVSSRVNLSQWFCEAHNEVNRKLGKVEFDCRLVGQRWRDGWSDGSCG